VQGAKKLVGIEDVLNVETVIAKYVGDEASLGEKRGSC